MDTAWLAVALGLLSAVTLAAANMSIKMGSDILVGRAILSCSAALLILPATVIVPFPDRATWLALGAALPVHFAYQLCLVKAMQRADLSLVFPIMRGAAPLLTALCALALLHEPLSLPGWAGLVLATGSLFVFATPPKGMRLREHPDRHAMAWALATAVGISLYNVADARGVRIALDPFSFIVWLFLLDSIAITTLALAFRRASLLAAVAQKWRYGVAAGALSIVSFGSALLAFDMMETARVAALRETAVVFAALMGMTFLGEGFGMRRVIASVVLASGLLVMQFGG